MGVAGTAVALHARGAPGHGIRRARIAQAAVVPCTTQYLGELIQDIDSAELSYQLAEHFV